MQYTKEQLDNMDDVQIDLAVSKKLGLIGGIVRIEQSKKEYIELTDKGGQKRTVFAPCECWDDVMPIAISEWISFDTHGNGVGKYTAYSYGSTFTAVNKNPRRAICEVFLMMER
jgi:hypothetical protein